MGRTMLLGAIVLVTGLIAWILLIDDSTEESINKAGRIDLQEEQAQESPSDSKSLNCSNGINRPLKPTVASVNASSVATEDEEKDDKEDDNDSTSTDDESEDEDPAYQEYLIRRRECARLFMKEKKYINALACFRELEQQDPEDDYVQLGLGAVNASLGNRNEGYYHYEKALALNPDGPRAREIEKVLDDFDKFASNNDIGPERMDGLNGELHSVFLLIRECRYIFQRGSDQYNPIKLSIWIEPDGTVGELRVVSQKHQGTPMALCLERALIDKKVAEPFEGERARMVEISF